jgi:hypothetical protein
MVSFFELARVQDALNRKCCRDANGEEPWACGECDHPDKLERKLAGEGETDQRSTEAQPPRAGQPAQRHDRLPLDGAQVLAKSSSTMDGRLPECLAKLFIVSGSAWRVVALIGAEERLR